MLIQVEMRAFAKGAIRTVDVPEAEWQKWEAVETRLGLVYKYGQNDFQPQRMPSVSVGDVVRLGERRFEVAPFGFVEAAALTDYEDADELMVQAEREHGNA